MHSKTWLIIAATLLLALVFGLMARKQNPDALKDANKSISMKIESDAFKNDSKILVSYTCNGAGEQVPLKISGAPDGAKSLALIVDDPDAPNGDFVHWVLWNIGPETKDIENGVPAGAVEGYTSLGKPGWVAPCPPSGVHHYNFKLYAMDTILSIPKSSAKADLVRAMDGHILDSAVLVGLYGKGN